MRLGLVIMALALAGCGGPGGELGSAPAATPTAAQTRCRPASAGLVTALSTGLNAGVTLRKAFLVRSADFEQAYFVSGDLEGPGLDGEQIATWVTNETDGSAGFYAVNPMAREFSDWGDGGQTDAAFAMSGDGARESQECIQ
jgi:hypothetical protein